MMKVTPKNARKLVRLLEEEKRLDIMCRFWPMEKLCTVFGNKHPFNVLVEKRDEIAMLLFGSSEFVEIGLSLGVLEEHPKETRKKAAAKRKKELEDRFDDKPKKKKKKGKKKKKMKGFFE